MDRRLIKSGIFFFWLQNRHVTVLLRWFNGVREMHATASVHGQVNNAAPSGPKIASPPSV